MPDLPPPILPGDEYLAAVLAELGEIKTVMQQVADNTIPRTMRVSKVEVGTGDPQAVKIREPAPGPAEPLTDPKPDPEAAPAAPAPEERPAEKPTQKPAARKPRAAGTGGASKPAARKTGGKTAKPKPTADGDA